MKRNEHAEFVGVNGLKPHHQKQLDKFEAWASRGEWLLFHQAHYDWWMFPIDRPSSYGFMWVVYEGDICELKKDAGFMQHFRRGLELVALSWGWDIQNATEISAPQSHQLWHEWPVRLFKMALSAKLFGEIDAFESLKKYALLLMSRGHHMTFGGNDLSWLFTTGIDPQK